MCILTLYDTIWGPQTVPIEWPDAAQPTAIVTVFELWIVPKLVSHSLCHRGTWDGEERGRWGTCWRATKTPQLVARSSLPPPRKKAPWRTTPKQLCKVDLKKFEHLSGSMCNKGYLCIFYRHAPRLLLRPASSSDQWQLEIGQAKRELCRVVWVKIYFWEWGGGPPAQLDEWKVSAARSSKCKLSTPTAHLQLHLDAAKNSLHAAAN